MFKKIVIVSLFLLIPHFAFGAANRLEEGLDEWKAKNAVVSPTPIQTNQNNEELTLYRNDEYHFRIKFPTGWEIKDGDGEHVVKKAVKDGSTVFILVREFSSFLSETDKKALSDKDKQDLQSAELSNFSEEESNLFLETIVAGQLESFPGSTILEKGIRYVDNRKAIYFKMNQVYRVQDRQIEGISINYFTLHRGKLYQLGGAYPMIPISDKDKEPIINSSLSTFVFEDWSVQGIKETNPSVGSVNSSENIVELKIQAKNEILDRLFRSFVVGLFLLGLVVVTLLFSWLYSKITGKKIRDEKAENGILVASRAIRLANFALDFFIFINCIFYFITYLAIQQEWYWVLLRPWSFSIGGIVLYYVFFEWLFGRTPGKFITRTKVITKYGTKPNFAQIIGRTLTRLIPFEALSFLGAYYSGWHDTWSNTLVVPSTFKLADKIISVDTKYCKECGDQIDVLAAICNRCSTQKTKKRRKELLLAISAIIFVTLLISFVAILFS